MHQVNNATKQRNDFETKWWKWKKKKHEINKIIRIPVKKQLLHTHQAPNRIHQPFSIDQQH